ncbi:hypothetical protein DYB32_005446 [Aphanomyces invadans]|uniref:glutathione gamma-glutamylcysteinyltransferase n=1 Tax=Aphanomyces invadans TaxID=157072 RepID=A0A3R6VKX2_9STRA|nr:hypothetical protein DYB32_005446 [Aphanomyces invadans]
MALKYADPAHPATAPGKGSLIVSVLLFPVHIVGAVTVFVLSVVVGIPCLLYLYLFHRDMLTTALTPASKPSIEKRSTNGRHYKDSALLQRAWERPVGQLYLDRQLEFQRREGYCAPTTLRNVLKSIPSVPLEHIPEAQPGPWTAQQFQTKLDSVGFTSSTIVYGNASYDVFLDAIKRSNDTNVRVAMNFLHPALFGMDGPSFLPHVMLMAILGGHFANIVGYLEDVDLVVVFDVNHDYGPYLVPSTRLYEAVRAVDVQSGMPRALIVSDLVHPTR